MTKEEKYDQESHRCKRPEHPTTFVDKEFHCHKAGKCSDKGKKGCITR